MRSTCTHWLNLMLSLATSLTSRALQVQVRHTRQVATMSAINLSVLSRQPNISSKRIMCGAVAWGHLKYIRRRRRLTTSMFGSLSSFREVLPVHHAPTSVSFVNIVWRGDWGLSISSANLPSTATQLEDAWFLRTSRPRRQAQRWCLRSRRVNRSVLITKIASFI